MVQALKVHRLLFIYHFINIYLFFFALSIRVDSVGRQSNVMIYCYNPLYHRGELKGKVLCAGVQRGAPSRESYSDRDLLFPCITLSGRMASLLWVSDFEKQPDLSPCLMTQKVYWPAVSLRQGY